METPHEQKVVRLHPRNEESGRPIRNNMDVEGALWSGVKVGKYTVIYRLVTVCKRQLRRPVSKGSPKFKIDV